MAAGEQSGDLAQRRNRTLYKKTTREAGMGTWPLGLEVLSLCLGPLGMWRLYGVWLLCRLRLSFALFMVFDNSTLTFVATFAVSTLYLDAV